jgi:hypothetical protein
MLELPPETTQSLVDELFPRRRSRRNAQALRMVAACAFAIAVVIAPSKTNVEADVRGITLRDVPLTQVSSIQQAAPPPQADPQVLNARSTRAVPAPPPPRRERHEQSYPERPTRQLTEADLGLKAPY